MSTAAQINANQLNAQSSTGPRTEEGKSIASKNATKHGLTAATPVIRSEEEQTQCALLQRGPSVGESPTPGSVGMPG